MSEEFFAQYMRAVIQSICLHLVEVATGDEGPIQFQTRQSGDLTHLRLRNDQGAVLFQVSGKNTGELAWQLLLSCFHSISIDQLKDMHKRPLRRALAITRAAK